MMNFYGFRQNSEENMFGEKESSGSNDQDKVLLPIAEYGMIWINRK